MLEGDEQLHTLKQEIIEARSLAIRTNNLVNALGADIKSIAKRQAGYERRFNWNGGIFLAVATGLVFIGLSLASDARISEIEASKETLSTQVKELEAELADVSKQEDARSRASATATKYYKLAQQKQRREFVRVYPKLEKDRLSRVERLTFDDLYSQFQQELSFEDYRAALGLYRGGRFAEARDKLESARSLAAAAPHANAVSFELARTLRKLNRPVEALAVIDALLKKAPNFEKADITLFLAMRCAKEDAQYDHAERYGRELMRRFPRSSYVQDTRLMLRDLRLKKRKTSALSKG